MLGFPQTTEFNKRIPKQKFYEKIEVLEICLTQQQFDEALLRQIDKEIPYHILFVLSFGGKYQAWIGFKEAATSGTKAFKVGRYYHTDWVPEDELEFTIDGLNMDVIYDNFVRQIAGDALQSEAGETLKETVQRNEQKQVLQKQIEALESKIRKEKQFNRQIKMNAELKKLRKELEML